MSAQPKLADQIFEIQSVCCRNVPQVAEASDAAAHTSCAVIHEHVLPAARVTQDLGHTQIREAPLLIHSWIA